MKNLIDKKIIGILGGMGPASTADFFTKLVKITKARNDNEHARVLIYNNPLIPDRTESILAGGDSPVPMLIDGIAALCNMGSQIIAIPCNTAHYYYHEIVNASSVPVLNILEETVSAVIRRGYKRAALLATAGTYRSGIYQKAFSNSIASIIMPDENDQKFFFNLAYKVKEKDNNYDKNSLIIRLNKLRNAGAECFVLGCTEIPMAFAYMGIDDDIIDSSLELARAALLSAGYEVLI